jgi:hypothetical protein
MESINVRYCRSLRGVTSVECHESHGTSKPTLLFCRDFYAAFSRLYRQSMLLRLAQLVPRSSRSEPREKLVHGAREQQDARGPLWVIHDPHE